MPKVPDIREVIDKFEENREVNLRYASYDFCYSYFQQNRGSLSSNGKMEHSCWVLWGYLASWGMLRGSSELLNLSPAALKPLIEYFDKLDDTIWNADVPMYGDSQVKTIKEVYDKVAAILKTMDVSPTKTLVTKIMMGVFGCIPAYDSYFTKTFRGLYKNQCAFRVVNEESLKCIYEFYKNNITVLDAIKIEVIDFWGNPLKNCNYKIAKLIDMYGFTVEDKRVKARKAANKVITKLKN